MLYFVAPSFMGPLYNRSISAVGPSMFHVPAVFLSHFLLCFFHWDTTEGEMDKYARRVPFVVKPMCCSEIGGVVFNLH